MGQKQSKSCSPSDQTDLNRKARSGTCCCTPSAKGGIVRWMIAHSHYLLSNTPLTIDNLKMIDNLADFAGRFQHRKDDTVCVKEITMENGQTAELLTCKGGVKNAALIYFHGGAFILGSAMAYRGMLAELCRRSQMSVFVPNYTKSYEKPFPQALDECEYGYNWFCKKYKLNRAQTIIGGDSAGGNLTLAVLQKLMADEGQLPGGVVLIDPWLDLTIDSREANRRCHETRDPLLPGHRIARVAQLYHEDRASRNNPLISPKFMTDEQIRKMPPTLIHIAEQQFLRQEIEEFTERIPDEVLTCRRWPGLFHVFQLAGSYLLESAESLDDIGRWANQVLGLDL